MTKRADAQARFAISEIAATDRVRQQFAVGRELTDRRLYSPGKSSKIVASLSKIGLGDRHELAVVPRNNRAKARLD